jgi:hypothetical protein
MLVALIMFAFITLAAGFALSASIRGQERMRNRVDEIQEVRTLLDVLGRDIRSAYASQTNPNTFFYATGNETGTLLTFSTLSHRIQYNPAEDEQSQGEATQVGMETGVGPQSDVVIVSYTYDDTTGTLLRTVTNVPSPEAQPEADPLRHLLSRNIRGIYFEFLQPADSASGVSASWRNEWTFTNEQAQQAAQAGAAGAAGATGTGGATGQQGAPADAASSTNSDTELPGAVRVTVEIASPEGPPRQYTTTIGIQSPTPQPKGQVPEPPPAATGGTGSGGNNNGGNNGGNGGPGGGSGGPGGGSGGPGGGSGGPGGGSGGGPRPGTGGLPGLPGMGGARP